MYFTTIYTCMYLNNITHTHTLVPIFIICSTSAILLIHKGDRLFPTTMNARATEKWTSARAIQWSHIGIYNIQYIIRIYVYVRAMAAGSRVMLRKYFPRKQSCDLCPLLHAPRKCNTIILLYMIHR